MIKKHGIFAGIAVLIATAMFIVTGCPMDSDDEEDDGIAWTIVANGGEDESSTQLTITFAEDVNDLESADITLTNGTGAVTKGALSGGGKTWNLAITLSTAGTIRVKITRAGIHGAERTVSVWAVSRVSWTKVTDSTFGATSTTFIYCVAYGEDKFVAGGNQGKMAYSADGITWTAVGDSTFGSAAIYSVAYGGGKFVATGAAGKMAYSADGVTWTAVADSTFNTTTGDHIFCVAYGGGKFVAGGRDGYDGAKMAYSTDGITWTAVADTTFTNTSSSIRGITYGGGKFIAVGGEGYYGKMVSSTDGVTWTYNHSFGNSGILGITYGDGKFVAGGEYGKIEHSTDGVTWDVARTTNTFTTSYTYNVLGVAYGGGKFVAVGESTRAAFSADGGATWVLTTNPYYVFINHINGVAYGGGRFVAVGDSGIIGYSNRLE